MILDALAYVIAHACNARAERYQCAVLDQHAPELVHQGDTSILLACLRPDCLWVADLPLVSVDG